MRSREENTRAKNGVESFDLESQREPLRKNPSNIISSLRSNDSKCGSIQMEDNKNHSCEKYFGWIRDITVEPTMFLYKISYMITSVIQQEFFIQKACRVDHGFSEEICNNLSANNTIQAQVQVTVSTFHQWNDIASHAIPIILAFFMGNWSDRRGRKAVLLLAIFGKIIYSGMIVVNSVMPTWNLNTIVYTASLPMTLLGSDVAIFASCFAYISDVSSSKQRTLRVGILDAAYLSTLPTGIALGSYLFSNVVNRSYTVMFTINAALLVFAAVYSAARLEMRTTPQQQPLEKGENPFLDFFDKDHVVASVTTLIKPRPARRRLYLWILLLAMAFYTFQRNETSMGYLYTQLVFAWNVSAFSTFRTYQSSLYVVAMILGIPIMNKFLGMRDTTIVFVGVSSQILGRILFATASIPELFYVGATVSALGPTILPVIRSMSSKIVPPAERGKVFALLSVCDNAAPLISGPLYTQLYNATLTTTPSAIYWLSFASQVSVLLLTIVIHVSLGNRQLDCASPENVELFSPETTKRRRQSAVIDTENVLPASNLRDTQNLATVQ